MEAIKKIHHISAIVGDPRENISFYEGVLKLRLVKQTVNFDDPETYHLYFGNDLAEPGTLITFFPWTTASRGRVGSGQVGRIVFRVPKGSLGYWNERLTSFNIEFQVTQLFLKPTIEFFDPHGLSLALVEGDDVGKDKKILRFHGTTLLSSSPKQTVKTLTDELGLIQLSETEENYHLETVGEEKHHIIVPKERLARGRFGVGTVHHIAWSAPDDTSHRQWQDYLYEEKYNVTEIKDRQYFNAIYFIEKGNIVFEIATDGPGFTINESLEHLGESLMLPPQFESLRPQLESHLPSLSERGKINGID